MARDLRLPIVVVDGRDVSLHDSLHSAIVSLEGVDVAGGTYKVFDAEGRRIRLRAEGVRDGWFTVDIGTVHVDTIERTPTGVTEFREARVAYVSASDIRVANAGDIATLLDAVRRRT